MACKTPVKISKSPVIESKTDSTMNVRGITHIFLVDLLKQYPDLFQSVLSNPDNKVQIIYTQIDRGNNGNPNSLIIILMSRFLFLSRINREIADRNFGLAKIKRAENCRTR
jgi:hypothetical protein